ncbi:glycosyltransferase [Desmonostoc muscorum LEGE 12446]|uniref:Glycosyltransferase n=1 Tax=Desmonostoc muscorum LEGE 12446 TaxID=1828758 RepID=A0A8J6ZTX0_DESMC|nr:glycosyltransferase [Desmonostoc muscorum]MCF2146675.1 glycosyltransferase [Desmonostoc muscorum LEGE 12446]
MTILMYHKVYLESPSIWWVTVDDFYRQMLELKHKKIVYLDEYNPSDPEHVVITFDGVYKNVLDYAAPILSEFNYPFELFVTSDYIGIDNFFDTSEPQAQFANFQELEILVKNNGRLQWHTKSHCDLTNEEIPVNFVEELEVPHNLEKIDPTGFKWFAYPYGKFNERLIDQVKLKFEGAVSCHQGNDHDLYRLNRITVTNETTFKKATITVIIPSYNYGSFLVEAIESVLRQTRMPDEILISDDASTDDTSEIAKFYQATYPNLIKININENNLGVVKHFNKAVSLTKSDYITFLGADNRFRSDFIEKTSLILDTYSDVAIAYSDFALFGKRAKLVYDSFPQDKRGLIKNEKFFIINFPEFNHVSKQTLLNDGNFIHGSSMFRRQAFDEVSGYFEKPNVPEDYDLFRRIVKAGWNAKKAPFPLLEYRQHSKYQANVQLGSFNELQFYKKLLAQSQSNLEQLQIYLQHNEAELEKAQKKIIEKEKIITEMENSNFLKMRKTWLKLIQLLGIKFKQ